MGLGYRVLDKDDTGIKLVKNPDTDNYLTLDGLYFVVDYGVRARHPDGRMKRLWAVVLYGEEPLASVFTLNDAKRIIKAHKEENL